MSYITAERLGRVLIWTWNKYVKKTAIPYKEIDFHFSASGVGSNNDVILCSIFELILYECMVGKKIIIRCGWGKFLNTIYK